MPLTVFTMENGKKIILDDNNFVAMGGEAVVYAKNDICYKIYHDKQHMTPLPKIEELRSLGLPNIIKPESILIDSNGTPIGFTMKRVNGYSFPEIFTTSFWKEKKLTTTNIIPMIKIVRNTTDYLHNKGFLIIDGNELAYITNLTEVFFLDINSYATPSFPILHTVVIMPTIKDVHSNQFSALTDWFSFGVVTFQLFVGIHPYKGMYPGLDKGTPEDRLRKRMEADISVLHKDVEVNNSVRDFALIPRGYYEWYRRIFEDGVREPPPPFADEYVAVVVPVKVIKSTDKLVFIPEYTFPIGDEIVNLKYVNGKRVTQTTNYIYFNDAQICSSDKCVIFSKLTSTPIYIEIRDGELSAASSLKMNQLMLSADGLFIIDNILYVKQYDQIIEINFTEMNNRIVISIKKSYKCSGFTQAFDGVFYRNLFGHSFLFMPLDDHGESIIYIKKVDELYGHRIIDIKYSKKVCIIITMKDGFYYRFNIVFNNDHTKYKIREEKDVINIINFVVKDNGIVAAIHEDKRIEIYTNNIDDSRLNVISNEGIRIDMKLFTDGGNIYGSNNNELFKVVMN